MLRSACLVACITGLVLSSTAAIAGAAPAPPETKPETTAASRFLNPPGLPAASGYSHVVVAPVGHTIHVSGQLPLDKDGQLVGAGDFAAQAEQVFANLDIALTAAGATFDNVVRLDMYVTDMGQLKALRAARDRYINLQHPPASTLVEIRRLVRDGALLEIAATAVVRDAGAKATATTATDAQSSP